jgi:hypothetical protein
MTSHTGDINIDQYYNKVFELARQTRTRSNNCEPMIEISTTLSSEQE